MSWTGSGSWARLFSWVADKAAAINITASRMDAEFNDYASNGFGNTLTRDGQGVPTANLPMAGFRHLNVASSQARAEYLATAQLQDGGPIWGGTSTGAANVYVITLAPVVTGLVAGMRGSFLSHQANTGAATLQVNATAAKAITKNGAAALAPGDIPNGALILWEYDGTQFQLLSAQACLALGGGTLSGGVNEAQATLASAATVNIGAAAGNDVLITGTTGITAFDNIVAGAERTLEFQGILTLTNNASIKLLNGASRLTQAGDKSVFRSQGAGVWAEIAASKALGTPLTVAPTGGFKNLQVTVGSNTAFTIIADSVVLEDANGQQIVVKNVNVTVTLSGNGANGLDAAAQGANAWYNGFVICNPAAGTIAGLGSLSATAPTMPAGYTYKGRVCAVRSDGATHLWRTIASGRQTQIIVDGAELTALPLMASGVAGTNAGNPATWSSIAVASFVPPTASGLKFSAGVASHGTGAYSLAVAPNNQYAAMNSATNNPPYWTGDSSSGVHDQTMNGTLVLESTNIFYISTAAFTYLACTGWEDNI